MYCSSPQVPGKPLNFLTGFEGTQIKDSGTDVLVTTDHMRRYKTDLEMLATSGITMFRACIPWHTVEAVEGVYDWSWVDDYLGEVQRLKLLVIADPLHHTGTPPWLTDGLADSRLKESYLQFMTAFAHRYPWVTHYTVMNEPFVTTWLAGCCGVWHPYHNGEQSFVRMLLNVCKMINEVTGMLKKNVRQLTLVHVDTCERHIALDQASLASVERGNQLRFIALDLILGRVDEQSILCGTISTTMEQQQRS